MTSPGVLVVAIALIDDEGRILAAQRREGSWEFPGGKVEPGESDTEALERECREELAVRIKIHDRLGSDVRIHSAAQLRVWTGQIAEGEPIPLVHKELRWLTADQLSTVAWLPSNRVLIDQLRADLLALDN